MGGGGYDFRFIGYTQKHCYIRMFLALFGSKNIMDVDTAHSPLLFLLFAYLKKRTIIYSHSGEWAYDMANKTASKLKVFLSNHIHKNNLILCVSKHQEQFLKQRFGQNIKTSVVNVSIGLTTTKITKQKGQINIIMSGSMQKRKGIELYSKLADLAKQNNEQWNFYWLGHPDKGIEKLYISKNITFVRFHIDVNAILKQMDIFFLSSIDEPFAKVALEALSQYKKVVVYRKTGTAEIIEDISGCGIYENYEVQDAYNEIQKVLQEPLDKQKVQYINDNISSIESFTKRMDGVLKSHWAKY